MTALFKLSNLTVSYSRGHSDKTHDVLHGISTEIRAGAFTVVIGPNGSGKSTLLRALAGLQPYNGSARLMLPNHASVTQEIPHEIKTIPRRQFARTVGVVPQDFRPAYPFPVWEVIAMGRLPYRALLAGDEPDINERVLVAAERVGVAHLLSRDATTLSGGEAQRVLLACVLAQDPPVMLLDEPTSALDPNQAVRVLALLRDLLHESCNQSYTKRTIIAVMHDVNIALAFADYYLALKDGRLCSSGPIANLNGEVLKELYDTDFEPYRSKRGDVIWKAC